MLRRPANLELFIPEADSTKVVAGVLYLKGMPPITADSIVNCNLLCPSTGAAKVVKVCPVIADGCDCPFTWELQIDKLPDLLDYGTDNTFIRPHFYSYEAPNGATPTQAVVAAAITASINADPDSPVTAAVDGEDNCIVLTGKANGPTWNVYAPSSTITVSVAGTNDELTTKQIQKMFPIQVGVFGQAPAAVTDIWCGCKCLLKVKVQFCCESDLPSDAMDVSMDRALLGHEYEFIIPVPCTFNEVSGTAVPADPTNWAEPWKALAGFFTCLVAAA